MLDQDGGPMKTVVVDWSRSVRGQIRDQEENRQGG